jgi:hypothetical protein
MKPEKFLMNVAEPLKNHLAMWHSRPRIMLEYMAAESP